jgi:osmotically-inducible protein OsmY
MRRSAGALLCAGWLSLLPGCVPLVATGVGTGALMAENRRTTGAQIDDDAIEAKITWRIGDHFGRDTHVDVTSFNRIVLLVGSVPDESARQEIERIARSADNVRAVQNELSIGPPPPVAEDAHDAYVTSKIKALFLDSGKFYPNHVKVNTEGTTVYLMGLVKHKEADEATEIARSVSGVNKVVRIFEYLD